MGKYFFFLSLILFSLSACDETSVKHPTSEWIEKTQALDSANTRFYVRQTNEFTRINIYIDFPENYQFPQTINEDTLSITDFCLDIYSQDEIIKTDSIFAKENQLLWQNSLNKLQFRTSKYQLFNREVKIKIEIPNYAFHNLKAGEHELMLHLYQDSLFTLIENGQYNKYKELIGEKITLLDGKIKFQLKIPEIFHRKIEFKDLELYITSNSDFTLINKGFADIYWQIRTHNKNVYYTSPVIKQTKIYREIESVNYFYLANKPQIEVYVWDWDAFSKDDLQGKWRGNLKYLDSLADYRELSFDNVKYLHIKSTKESKVN